MRLEPPDGQPMPRLETSRAPHFVRWIAWSVLVCAAAARAEPPRVTSRAVPGTQVRQVVATGLIDAPPARVAALLADVPRCAGLLPHVVRIQLLKRAGNTSWNYFLVDAPFVSAREFVLRMRVSRQRGAYLLSWRVDPSVPAPHTKGALRLWLNRGHWLLVPRDRGRRTFATYVVLVDPGGSVPAFLTNGANADAARHTLEALRQALQTNKPAPAPPGGRGSTR